MFSFHARIVFNDSLLFDQCDGIVPARRPLPCVDPIQRCAAGLEHVAGLHDLSDQYAGFWSNEGDGTLVDFEIEDVIDEVAVVIVGVPVAAAALEFAQIEEAAAVSVEVILAPAARGAVVEFAGPSSAAGEMIGDGEFFLSASDSPPCFWISI